MKKITPELLVEAWHEEPERVAMAMRFAAAFADQLELKPGMRCLEFGCGRGNLALLLPPELAITALDPSPEAIAALRAKLAGFGRGNIEVCEADILDFPERAGYDLIYSTLALHHIEDLSRLLHKCARLLKPGGAIALVDLDREDGSFHDDHTGIFHFGFDRGEFAQELADAGFRLRFIGDIYCREKTFADGRKQSYPMFLAVARLDAGR
ncbi:MAG: class I SAM-dependent methyltransferase [Victivallaceae bacterium]